MWVCDSGWVCDSVCVRAGESLSARVFVFQSVPVSVCFVLLSVSRNCYYGTDLYVSIYAFHAFVESNDKTL